MSRKLVAARLQDLRQAPTYRAWCEVAQELDRLEGADAWRQDETSDDYDYLLIKERLAKLRALRRAGDVRELVFELQDGLHGNLGNIGNPALYCVARSGTKQLIEDYVAETVRCLHYVCAADSPTFSEDDKTVFFQRTGASFGRSALLLSGGATLGLFHLGVIKALVEEDLLPRVLSGSSAGSIIAGIVGTRTDAELRAMFAQRRLDLQAFQRVGLRRALAARAVMDSGQLVNCLRQNVGEYTFQEAFERTRRIVGVSVSPVEPHQQGRLLNYLTAPNVLLSRAILASCAVPGVFAPVTLQARDFDGQVVPYMPSKRWIDGTLSADLPMLRLARLHNVNHYIVSQTNPHVVPFMRNPRAQSRGLLPFARELVLGTSRHTFRLMREHLNPYAVTRMADKLNAVIAQNYSGDINLYPRLGPRQLLRMFANPSAADIDRYIHEGERATWPQLERIRLQTRISRTLEDCLRQLKERARRAVPACRPDRDSARSCRPSGGASYNNARPEKIGLNPSLDSGSKRARSRLRADSTAARAVLPQHP